MNHMAVRIAKASLLALTLALLFGSVARAADDNAALYKAKCSTCHAANGSGNTDMGKSTNAKDLRSPEVQKMTDQQLNDAITNGKGDEMPPYKAKLTAAQITGLVSYVRGLAKK